MSGDYTPDLGNGQGLLSPEEWREPLHHRDGPVTERNPVPAAGTLRMTALLTIASAFPGGLTDGELAESTGEYLYTMAPRRKELVDTGWVEDSGTTRETVRRRPAIVWRLTVIGREQLIAMANLDPVS